MEILSSRTLLWPTDYDRTVAFYGTTLGLAVAREYPGGTVFFAGQSLVEVASHRPDHAPPGPPDDGARSDTALWWQVRDVYAVQADLETARRDGADVRIVRPARQEPWGLHELWITDPDGTPIVLVQIPDDHPIRRDSRPAPPRPGAPDADHA